MKCWKQRSLAKHCDAVSFLGAASVLTSTIAPTTDFANVHQVVGTSPHYASRYCRQQPILCGDVDVMSILVQLPAGYGKAC